MNSFTKRILCSLSLIGCLSAGEVDFNVKMNSVANTVATYWNENATGIYIYLRQRTALHLHHYPYTLQSQLQQ